MGRKELQWGACSGGGEGEDPILRESCISLGAAMGKGVMQRRGVQAAHSSLTG